MADSKQQPTEDTPVEIFGTTWYDLSCESIKTLWEMCGFDGNPPDDYLASISTLGLIRQAQPDAAPQ